MQQVTFNYRQIKDIEDFYRQVAHGFAVERTFGNNLDALGDALIGMTALPAQATLRHLSSHIGVTHLEGTVADFASADMFRLRIGG